MTIKNPFKKNKFEIIYKLINSALAGLLVFVGAFADGTISKTGVSVAIFVAVLMFLKEFKTYWKNQEKEYTIKNILNFI